MPQPSLVTRRQFLSSTATASLGVTAFPYVITSGALAAPGRPGANDRIRVGHIGVGGMGCHHLKALKDHVGAICDVDAEHLKTAAEMVGRDVPLFDDYRRILERDDIDAVIIATPDHWHGVMTVDACKAGKDVYCEKPAAKTIEEGAAMVRAARRYGRVVQVGSQGRSTFDAYQTCAFIRSGEIGRVSRVTCWHKENPVGGSLVNAEPPATLDWDRWLGPARWVPYNKDRCHFNFRWLLDFGGGQIRDRGAHVFSLVLWCLQQDHAGPVAVHATGVPPRHGLWDCPPRMDVVYEFKDPDWTLVWRQPGTDEAPWSDRGFGAKYQGDRGSVVLAGGDGGCSAEPHVRNYRPSPGARLPQRSPGHYANFFGCMRTRQKPIMDIQPGVRVSDLCVMANISYRLGRKLAWDPVHRKFVNDDEANRWLCRPGRGSWHL